MDSTSAPDAADDAEPEPDTSGWFRNTALTALTVQPDGYPATVLAPGEPGWLPRDPRNPQLEPCDAPPPVAADPETES